MTGIQVSLKSRYPHSAACTSARVAGYVLLQFE